MSDFRQIHTRIYIDDWFSALEPDAKLFFIYLFSNSHVSVSGLYELPVRTMCFETGLEQGRVLKLLGDFAKDHKVYYEDAIVWVTNLRKYQESSSQKLQARILSDVSRTKECPLKQHYLLCMQERRFIPYSPSMENQNAVSTSYAYPIDTLSANSPDTDTDTETETDTETRARVAAEIIPSPSEEPKNPPSGIPPSMQFGINAGQLDARKMLEEVLQVPFLPNTREWQDATGEAATMLIVYGTEKTRNTMSLALGKWIVTRRKPENGGGTYSKMSPGWVRWAYAYLNGESPWEKTSLAKTSVDDYQRALAAAGYST